MRAVKLGLVFMDRIDLWVSVGQVDYKKLGEDGEKNFNEQSEKIKMRVLKARDLQKKRFEKYQKEMKHNLRNNLRAIFCHTTET